MKESKKTTDKTTQLFNMEYIEEKFKAKEYGPIELCILKALHKYLFLDNVSLTRAVNQILNKRMQKPDYRRNIKNMIGKTVKKYTYTDERYHQYRQIQMTVYYLAYPAYQYMQQQYQFRRIPYRLRKKNSADILSVYDMDYIKERLMLNRWHLNICTYHKESLKSEKYCQKTRILIGKTNIHSLVYIKKETGKKILIIAIPYGNRSRTQEIAMRHLTEKIKELNKLGMRSINEDVILVIICDSYEAMKEAYNRIRERDTNAVQGLLYAIEADTVTEDILYRLYYVSGEGKSAKRTYYRISSL